LEPTVSRGVEGQEDRTGEGSREMGQGAGNAAVLYKIKRGGTGLAPFPWR
jgi:hypothetical protein